MQSAEKQAVRVVNSGIEKPIKFRQSDCPERALDAYCNRRRCRGQSVGDENAREMDRQRLTIV